MPLSVPKPATNDLIPTDRGNAYVIGTVAPINPVQGMVWVDTTTAGSPIIKTYNTGWVYGSALTGHRTLLASNVGGANSTTSQTRATILSLSGLAIPASTALELWMTFTNASSVAGANRKNQIGLAYRPSGGGASVDMGTFIGVQEPTSVSVPFNTLWRFTIPPRSMLSYGTKFDIERIYMGGGRNTGATTTGFGTPLSTPTTGKMPNAVIDGFDISGWVVYSGETLWLDMVHLWGIDL